MYLTVQKMFYLFSSISHDKHFDNLLSKSIYDTMSTEYSLCYLISIINKFEMAVKRESYYIFDSKTSSFSET